MIGWNGFAYITWSEDEKSMCRSVGAHHHGRLNKLHLSCKSHSSYTPQDPIELDCNDDSNIGHVDSLIIISITRRCSIVVIRLRYECRRRGSWQPDGMQELIEGSERRGCEIHATVTPYVWVRSRSGIGIGVNPSPRQYCQVSTGFNQWPNGHNIGRNVHTLSYRFSVLGGIDPPTPDAIWSCRCHSPR